MNKLLKSYMTLCLGIDGYCLGLGLRTCLVAIPYRNLMLIGNWTFRSQDHSLQGAKVPGVELSLPGTFAPWTFRSHH